MYLIDIIQDSTITVDADSFPGSLYCCNSPSMFNTTEEMSKAIEKKKEKNDMDIFNLNFGKIESDKVRLSPYGIAIKNAGGTWVSYDPTKNKVIDVSSFNFKVDGILWKVPVAVSAIKEGDLIIHNHKPMYVCEVYHHEDGIDEIWVADIYEGEQKSILPLCNMFNFNYVVKVVSLIDFGKFGDKAPDADNPFGGDFMRMMFVSEIMSDSKSDNDFSKLMMLSITMNKDNNPFNFFD